MLFVFSFLLSTAIVAVAVYQGRSLFGRMQKSLAHLVRLERGLAGIENVVAFQTWLIEWPLEDQNLATDFVKRLRRLCKGRPVHGWMIDPDHWCDGKHWFRSQIGHGQVQAMPGMLTGIGILFTFLGLTLGVLGLDPTDPERLTEGVRSLLGGMSLAFLTSIAGIGSALWWTWRSKIIGERFEVAGDRIAGVIRTKSFFTLPDEVPNRMLDKLSLQNQYLADMENTMMSAFRKALEDQGWPNLQEAIARVLGSRSSGQSVEKNLEGVRVAIEELTESSKLNLSLQQKILDSLQARGSDGGQVIDWGDPHARASFIRDAGALAGNVAKIHGSQEAVNDKLMQAATSLQELMESARVANADVIITHKKLTTHLERLEKHWDGYREQVLEMQKSLRIAIETFQKRIQTTLQSAHGEIDELLGKSLTHFTAALDAFESTVEGFSLLLKSEKQTGKRKWLDKLSS